MSSRWTRLLGVVGVVGVVPIGVYLFVWGLANDLPLWWMLLMAPVPVLLVVVAIQYLVLVVIRSWSSTGMGSRIARTRIL